MSASKRQTAVVFAYHNVGVRCLKVLAGLGPDLGLDILHVFTHPDNPAENIWFDNVAQTAAFYDLPVTLVHDSKNPQEQSAVHERLSALNPDFIFSFYYRFMMPASWLDIPTKGAYNLHGSLLPKYRGRVPVNWAVLHGETETGATLHAMTAKPDAGALFGQKKVPILPDDTAFEVFQKVTVACEQVLADALPGLLDGTLSGQPNMLENGSYFSGRTAEDGRIHLNAPAQSIYNLHRAVAPPYPGAFLDTPVGRVTLEKARLLSAATLEKSGIRVSSAGMIAHEDRVLLVGADLEAVELLSARLNDQPITMAELAGKLKNNA